MKSTLSPKEKNLAIKKNKLKTFPIVAIGASAGGLDAISILLKHLSPDTGMAFIFVQHLSPSHKSLLTPILSKVTKMKVQEVKDMEYIIPNNIYIIPNDKGIEVTDGHIKVLPRSKNAAAISIDVLFSSLAQTHKENVIGVILSGNAYDGTKGLKSIKDAGGVTFAQDDSAQSSSMPISAIESGVVDFILSPKEIAFELNNISKNGLKKIHAKKGGKEVENSIEDEDPSLKTILEIIHTEVNVDFSRYKMTTVKRRISHRMLQLNIKTLKNYVKILLKKNKEVDLLYKDLLINVTGFFRDAESFRYLKSTLLPKLLANKKTNEILRIWVPACSTGEEAYSIAMLLMELQDNNKLERVSFQIFATDLSDRAVRDARIGEYSESDLKPISKKLRERFFTKLGDNYRIVKELREMCVFAPHNILRDPPFSRIDFVSCRNLLIYFDTAAQKKALATISFALNDDGYLMLGKSETTGTSSQLFTQVNNKFRIYSRKKNTGIRKIPEISPRFQKRNVFEEQAKPSAKKYSALESSSFDNIIDSTLLSNYMPACAIINKDMEILKFRGATSLFLSHQSGVASLNILKMMRPEFAFELRNAIYKALETNKPVRKSGIELNLEDDETISKIVSLEVRSLKMEWEEPLLLVVFNLQEQIERYFENDTNKKNAATQKDLRIKKQAEELNDARTEMLKVFELQEKAYEDLQAANEEIISASEEFQTLNEELETSKEEIEATNEELLTTNQELQMRNEQLAEAFNFSEALAETMHEPMLILDTNLRIKSVNKAFYKKFLVLKTGTEGKLLYELGNHQWDIPRLRGLLESIVHKGASFYDYEITHEFPGIGKKTMLLNARRIVQKAHHEQLILLTFIDTTASAKERIEEKKELEDIISERTKELEKSYKSLEEKNLFLEKMNKELETFTFISSHDLQEPLRKIQTFATCLIEEEHDKISDAGKMYLQRMQDTVKRMQMLIEDLLAYARISKAGQDFEKADLNQITQEIVADFQDVLKAKKGVIQVIGLLEAKITGFQFRELIYNLISNSIKFSNPKKHPRIILKGETISGNLLNIEQLSTKITYCHISVVDNGIGFDSQYKDRIFEVFQRLHGQTEYKGTGIGLAICKRIVENHEGFISASGKLGKGAKFDIYIPAEFE